jgi:hypothetical protein
MPVAQLTPTSAAPKHVRPLHAACGHRGIPLPDVIGLFRGARLRQDAVISDYITFPKGKLPLVAAHDDEVIKCFARQHL